MQKKAKDKAKMASLLSGENGNGVIIDYICERVSGTEQVTGVMVGTVCNGMIVTGFSKTNLRAGDVYDKLFGIELAIHRAKGLKPQPELPKQLIKQHRDFQIRCLRYFKQAETLSVQGNYIDVGDQLLNAMPKEFKDMLTMFGGAGGIFGGIGVI